MIDNEGKINGAIDILTLEKTEKICEQMKTCIFKIYGYKIGTGFFCKILYNNGYIPVLITNYHIIGDEYLKNNKQIKISFNNEKIFDIIDIKEENVIYSSLSERYDIMIIKIKDENKYNYLELDDDLFNKNSEELYEEKSIYILHYSNEGNISVSFSYGIKKSNDICYIKHFCNIEKSSSGSPILNLSTNKVIGINKGSYFNINKINIYNRGILLKYPLNEMKIMDGNIIKMKIKINKEDIIKEIYFLDNTKEHRNLKELNINNSELYINNEKNAYKKYFFPDKEGIYSIMLKMKKPIKDCSYMFAYCNNLIDIDLSSFNSKNVKNIQYMFIGCNNLKNFDFSSLYSKIKTLFSIRNYKNILVEKEKDISKNKEIFLTIILKEFIHRIKELNFWNQKRINQINDKFRNMYEICIEPILNNDSRNNLNLISIIDKYLGNEDICARLLYNSSLDYFSIINKTLLNLENYEKYSIILEKLFEVFNEKKLDILLYLINLIENEEDEEDSSQIKKKEYEENENHMFYIFKLLYNLSIKNKVILKALIKEDMIYILLNYNKDNIKPIRDIIYNILLHLLKNITIYNHLNFDINKNESEGKIYFNNEFFIIEKKKEHQNEINEINIGTLRTLFFEKPELLKLLLMIMCINDLNNTEIIRGFIDDLFDICIFETKKIYELLDLISSLVQINDKYSLKRYLSLLGYPNLIIKNNDNKKYPIFGKNLINGDINEEIYEYITTDHNKKYQCLFAILFPSKYFRLYNNIEVKEEEKKKILLNFIKSIS